MVYRLDPTRPDLLTQRFFHPEPLKGTTLVLLLGPPLGLGHQKHKKFFESGLLDYIKQNSLLENSYLYKKKKKIYVHVRNLRCISCTFLDDFECKQYILYSLNNFYLLFFTHSYRYVIGISIMDDLPKVLTPQGNTMHCTTKCNIPHNFC